MTACDSCGRSPAPLVRNLVDGFHRFCSEECAELHGGVPCPC